MKTKKLLIKIEKGTGIKQGSTVLYKGRMAVVLEVINGRAYGLMAIIEFLAPNLSLVHSS